MMVEENQGRDDAPTQAEPLWPKTIEEWAMFVMALGNLALIAIAINVPCPAIPGFRGFVYSFAIVSILIGLIRFIFSLSREGNDKRYPRMNIVVSLLGLSQLALGIWGMALSFPNVGYLSDPSPETCQIGPMLCMLIPSVIIAIAIVAILIYGIYSVFKKKKEEVPAPASQGEQQIAKTIGEDYEKDLSV
mmetsp:Transcript_500/g.694  ORF Transcript_500/g.694 Transcript_500/m.694 type:complete len:190 (-) Transcript_500:34-603(-)